jgi:hypothetical protein
MSDETDYSVYQSLQCIICKYRLDGVYCPAFPDGIPPKVIAGTIPCPGGNGIKFRMKGEPKGERKYLKLVKSDRTK